MTEATTVTAEDTRRKLASGASTLLVCAYDDEGKCRDKHLDGAITMQQLNARLPTLSQDAEIVFYCA